MAVVNKVVLNRATNKFTIKTETDYSTFTDIDDAVPTRGIITILLDSGSGAVTIYENTDFGNPNYSVATPDSNPTITNPLEINLPLDSDGLPLNGDYTFLYEEEFDLTTTGTNSEFGVSSFTYSESVDVSPCLKSEVSCSAPSIKVYDDASYTVNSVVPTQSGVLTLEYPQTSGQADVTDSSEPFSISTSNVWTLGYQAYISLTLSYDFTTYEESVLATAELPFLVDCSSLCSVYACISSLRSELDSVKGVNNVKYNKLLATYIEVMAVAEQIDIAASCGNYDDIAPLVDCIKTLLNASECQTSCDTSCGSTGVSEKVYGLGTSSGGGGSALEVNNGSISDTAVEEIVIGEGLTLTNPISGTVNVVAEVTQAELDLLELAVLTNETNIGVNASDIAAIPNVQVSTLIIPELNFNVLDTVPLVISSGLVGKRIVYLGATIVSGGGTNGVVTCDLLISKDPTSGDSGQANAIATARLDSSEVATTTAGSGTSFSVAGGKALMDIGEELYITAVDSAVYDWVGTWNLSVSYIIL